MNKYEEYWSQHARNVGHRLAVTDLSEHDYRELYLDLFRQIAPKTVTRMLDYGCGPALLLPIVREIWPEATYDGCDVSGEMVSYCLKEHRDIQRDGPTNHRFWLVPDFADGMSKNKWDFLTCHSVFTHITLPDAVALLKELHQLLTPGGFASISIHSNPQGDNNFEGSIARVDYNPRFFKGMLVQAGFSIEKVYEHSVNNGQAYLGVRKV